MAVTSIQPGSVINNRYVIRRTIGSSEGSVVFEAEDTSLQRAVAVRVLLYEVLANEEWRDYVRHETTAVAALHHPNLTRIYDWGEDDGTIYVVTEYLAGGSLRDVLAAKGHLSQEQTALVGLEAATALAYAHARGFVHGALRPSKILFDDEGRARVSDLGMAATMQTIPGSARSLEEARYTTPEQVLGSAPEPRSDVYSLSLILFECLTGHAAHSGRSLETIRTNRLGAPLPHRPELGSLDLILALGAAPEIGARPDADLFASRLASVAATLPVPRPVTLGPGNLGGFVVPTATDVLSAPAIAITGRAIGDESTGDVVVRPFDLPGYRESVESSTHRPPPPRPSRTGRAFYALMALVVVLLALGLGIAWKAGAFTPSYQVPPLTGLTQAQALRLLQGDSFTLTVQGRVYSPTVHANVIVSQNPAANTMLKQGSTIHVVFSKGPATVTVPNVLLLGCKSAQAKLVTAGLSGTCPSERQVYNPTARQGAVVAVYAGTARNPLAVTQGTVLTLVLSKGPQPATTTTTTTTTTPNTGPRAVPHLVGLNRAQTLAAMQAAQLYYVTVGPGSNNATWTQVVSTSPPAGTLVPYRSSVTVQVR